MENQKFLGACPGEHSSDCWGRMHWHSPRSKALCAIPGRAGTGAIWLHQHTRALLPVPLLVYRTLPCSTDGEQQAEPHQPQPEENYDPIQEQPLAIRSLPAPCFGGSRGQVSPGDVHLSSWTDFHPSPAPRVLSHCWVPATMGMVPQAAARGSSLPSFCRKPVLCDTSGHSFSSFKLQARLVS